MEEVEKELDKRIKPAKINRNKQRNKALLFAKPTDGIKFREKIIHLTAYRDVSMT